MSTGTLRLKKLQHTNGTDIITLDSSGATTLTGNLTVDTNTLFVDATNNKVAVGTNSPNTGASAAALQINKDGEAPIFSIEDYLARTSYYF